MISAIIGVCLGNSIWLGGLVMLLVGILAVKVRKETVQKVVGLMSMTTGGQPKGPALKLKALIEPEVRTKALGIRMLLVAIVLLLLGSGMVVRCSQRAANCACASGTTMPCPNLPCPAQK